MTYRILWFISRQNVSFIISNRDRVCMPNDNFVFTFARFFRTLLHYVRPVWLIINLSETRCDDWSFKIYYFQHTQSFSIHKFFSWVYNLRWDHMSTTTELLSRGNYSMFIFNDPTKCSGDQESATGDDRKCWKTSRSDNPFSSHLAADAACKL